MKKVPLGIRNGNPGNILWNGSWKWHGQRGRALANGLFYCHFDTPEYGIRAMCLIFMSYKEHHGCTCIDDYIGMWSKGVKGGDPYYAEFVASRCNVDRHDPFDPTLKPMSFLKAVIHYENGEQPYSDTTIRRGITLSHER